MLGHQRCSALRHCACCSRELENRRSPSPCHLSRVGQVGLQQDLQESEGQCEDPSEKRVLGSLLDTEPDTIADREPAADSPSGLPHGDMSFRVHGTWGSDV